MIKILLIENNSRIATNIVRGLEIAGFQVIWYSDLSSINVQSISDKFDLIFIEENLPGLNLSETFQDWKKQGLKVPVLILAKNRYSMLMFKSDLIWDYIENTFEWKDLVSKIRELNAKSKEIVENEVEGLIFNPKKKEFTKNGKKIKFTKTEYKVLEYLFEHPNEILDKKQIIMGIYRSDKLPKSNVLDRHFRSIIEKCNFTPFTKIRKGYRLKM